MQDTINQRIVIYCEKKGYKQTDLWTAGYASKQTVQWIWKGRSKPGCEFLERFIAAHIDLNVRWLFTGEGEMTECVDQETQTIITYLEKRIKEKDDEIEELNRKLDGQNQNKNKK
ncbi:hypothetical protein [Dysgonomonas sp. HGC4]|uniref:hypothetical protein n=1 Tax=Dysgonomonas sp. HGC4 TaxID=1658009 RepID=UPI000681B09B|nr:hypothetical protein [Dysgonomonas sp. HGC4]MBD8349385.1 hypothetical protein [Dysgonomonas sp. HGC4]